MRRYLTLEEANAPAGINSVFQNIENNGAPWQFSSEDRLLWAKNLSFKDKEINIKTLAEYAAEDKKPEYLLWVGSAGAFDDRYKKVIRAFVQILEFCKVSYAVLGTEESDSGDVARRAGNEMLYQMQAMTNIEIMNNYGVKKIITCDPHDYNCLKNEYPDLGGNYEVIHHSQFIDQLLREMKLTLIQKDTSNSVTYHDPCYLGRANGEYNSVRNIIKNAGYTLSEMKRNRSKSLCCGAGGGQMFKEAEKGEREVFMARMDDVLETNAKTVITACPFCMTMLTDGIKYSGKESEMKNIDIAELVVERL